MNEWLSHTRRLIIAPAGVSTVTLESGAPYRNYTAWIAIAGTGTINVSVQPLFGGANDGSAVAFSATGVKKAYQVTTDEVRPPTTGLHANPADTDVVAPIKSELKITNSGVGSVTASIFMLAATGGA